MNKNTIFLLCFSLMHRINEYQHIRRVQAEIDIFIEQENQRITTDDVDETQNLPKPITVLQPNQARAYRTQAFIMHARNDIAGLKALLRIINNAYKVAGMDGINNYDYQSVAGMLANAKMVAAYVANNKPEFLRQAALARDAYYSAWQFDTNAIELCDMVFFFDMLLSDRAAIQKHAEEFLPLDPRYDRFQTALGDFYLEINDHETAETHYKKSIEIVPRVSNLSGYAEVLRRQGKADEAITYAQRAIEKDKWGEDDKWGSQEAVFALETLPMTLVDQGKYDEARVVHDKIIYLWRNEEIPSVFHKFILLRIVVGTRDLDMARDLRDEITKRFVWLGEHYKIEFQKLVEKIKELERAQ